MKQTAWVAIFVAIAGAIAMGYTMAAGSAEVAILDGTGWKVNVEPDKLTKDGGEKQFDGTLTFAEGNISFSATKVGVDASPYTVSQCGEKECTFKTSRVTMGEGASVWTGVIHGNEVEGKLIWTKNSGEVLTYTFKGTKLD
jgi:hypothetical protein